MTDARHITVLTWNLFHGQNGTGLGPTRRSTFLRRPIDDGTRLHENRKYIDEMAAVIRSLDPTIVALQEVPPQAVGRLAEETGMRAVRSVMHPVIGPIALRGWLADRNPDLWRTHEGTSNVILCHRDWMPETVWTIRHNPPHFAIREGHRLRLGCRERVHWVLEPRRLVGTRLRHQRDGRSITAISLHCHNSLVWDVIGTEMARVMPLVERHLTPDEPVIMAGDMNSAGSHHPAIATVLHAGFTESTVDDLVLDHIFQRGLTEVTPPTTLDMSARTVTVPFQGGERTVVLSDHNIVRAVYTIHPSSTSIR